MGVSEFVSIGGWLFLVSIVGFKWGTIERAASDFFDQSMS